MRKPISHTRGKGFVLIVVGLVLAAFGVSEAGALYAIDHYQGQPRYIPDVSGQPGDTVLLADDEIIDIVILAEGFLATDTVRFLSSDTAYSARSWYNIVFGKNTQPGLRPFNMFPQAFRVWGLFEASPERVSANRLSHYRVSLTPDNKQVGKGAWWDDATEPDSGFRDSLYKSLDELSDSLNLARYPDVVNNDPSGDYDRRFSHLYVVMITLADTLGPADAGDFFRPSGRSFPVQRDPDADPTDWVKVGVGRGEIHEWGHTFGYIKDEYIDGQLTVATESNPAIYSLWNIFNITFTQDRTDLPWKHLAPGGQYNPKARSMIGNLWLGSSSGGLGNWHSEYKCQINGTVDNYTCDFGSPPVYLRDEAHYCFWCEEIMATRILERTGEFDRLNPGVGTFEQKGIQWFNYWDQTLRDKYYSYFNYDSLINEKNQCYDLWSNKNTCTDCTDDCDTNPLPTCLPDCDIREIGNAFYADPTGQVIASGYKNSPLAAISLAIARADSLTPDNPLVVVRDGVQPAPITITTPVVIITDQCTPALLGK